MTTTSRLSRREFLQTAPIATALATAIRPSLVGEAPSRDGRSSLSANRSRV